MLLAQAWHEHVAAVNHAPQVHAERPLPIGDRHLADAAGGGHSRVVDQQIDAAEQAISFVAERLDVGQLRDVTGDRVRGGAARFGGGGGSGEIQIADDQLGAAAGELDAKRATEAAAAAGDHCARMMDDGHGAHPSRCAMIAGWNAWRSWPC